MDFLTGKLEMLTDLLVSWAPKVVGAIIVLLIGLWIIGKLTNIVKKALFKSGLDKDVVPFLTSLISVIMKVMLIISVAGIVGIETTAFIALIGMAGLAIGMAMQGTLGHFASGIMILIFKPYSVGDLVDIQGVVGTVDEIQVFNTVISSLENKKVIIPNGIATSGIMTNLSTNKHLRVDLIAAMPYEEDFNKVRGIIIEAIEATPGVMESPAPIVEIEKFNENSVSLVMQPYATTADYWDVYYGCYKNVKAALGKNNIKVAYPKREVVVANGKLVSSN